MTYSFSDWKAGKPFPKNDWDCADAIADGWSKADLDAFMRETAKEWQPARKPASKLAERDQGPAGSSKHVEVVDAPESLPVADLRDPDDASPVRRYDDSIPTGCGLKLSELPEHVAHGILSLRDWAFLSSDNVFYNMLTSETMSRDAFNLAMAPITPFVDFEKSDGSIDRKKFPPAKTLVEYLGGEIAAYTMYAPHIADRFFYADDIRYVNSYMQRTVPKADPNWHDHAAWQIIRDYIHFVYQDNAELLIKWLAHNVQHPGVKILWSPILIGIEGDGKTTIANILKSVMGRPNVQDVSPEALFSDFNSWAEGACVRVMDEIRVPGERRTSAMNKLKPVITNETVEVVRKGKDGKEIINVTNYIAMSNHGDALALTENDRRWAVMKTRFETKAQKDRETGDGFWERVVRAYKENVGVIRGWLLSVDLSDFNRTFGPEVNDEKRMMIEASRSSADADIREAIALGGEGVSNDVVVTSLLNERIKDIGGRTLSTSAMANILREGGWTKLDATVKWKGQTRRVYYRAEAVPADATGSTLVQYVRGLLDLTDAEGSGGNNMPDEELPW